MARPLPAAAHLGETKMKDNYCLLPGIVIGVACGFPSGQWRSIAVTPQANNTLTSDPTYDNAL